MHLTCSYISLWGCTRAQRTNIRMRTHISRERCCQATRSSPPRRLFFSLHLCFLWLLSKVKRRERIKQKQYFPFLLSMWKYVLSYNVLMLFILYCHCTCYLLLFFLNMPISKPAQICCYLGLFRKWKQAFSFFLLSGSTPSVWKSHNWGSQLQPIISHLSLWSGTAQWAVRSQTST